MVGGFELDSTESVYCPMAGSCEHIDEHWGSLQGEEFLA
jgi:hypothetical protein